MIVQSGLPDGWSVSRRQRPPRKDEYQGALDVLHQFLRSDGCASGTLQTVYQYSGYFEAAVMRLDIARPLYSNARSWVESDWEVPAEWSYRSPAADQFRFACAPLVAEKVEGGKRCRALMRYDEFVVYFSAPVYSGCMTLKEVEQSLAAIDARIETVLTQSRR